ncbi:hypothetical protein Lfee_0776 [Legionella feeleii]|uniref:Uncharacterized protein n=1 Tax=Legionella feeleii TaxID=453 RepID=A0A0W0U4S1_9GAMM|nr:hypothetical protein Lfee_0776 [Legionella feeleii]SPX62104.1 Uncharacterised protein [Legionella feeleii]
MRRQGGKITRFSRIYNKMSLDQITERPQAEVSNRRKRVSYNISLVKETKSVSLTLDGLIFLFSGHFEFV